MKAHSLLRDKQSTISDLLGLSLNDPKVIEKLFSDINNIHLAYSAAMGIAKEEQNTVQDIYDKELVDVMLCPVLGWGGSQYKLDEIEILGKSFKFSDYIDNPADFDQRFHFAEILLTAVKDGIQNGQFSKFQSDALKAAEHTLWIANPHTESNAIGGINGIYWSQQADEHDKKIKDLVVAFINDSLEETKPAQEISPFSEHEEQNIFPSIFSGEHEIVAINLAPLSYFLATHPNYELIAHDITELWNSGSYYRTPIFGGTIFSNPEQPYLGNFAYIKLYTDGQYQYYQPHGEVRGITFPFIYDKTTGIPLTMPLVDVFGNYDHTSTIETIYTSPETFNTPGHPNWYNPYWDQVTLQANQDAITNYFQTMISNSFINSLAPPSVNTVYNISNAQLEIQVSDILHDNSGNIDFSSLYGSGLNGGNPSSSQIIGDIHLANGMHIELYSNGSSACFNCNGEIASQLESAASTILHHI